MNIDAQGIDLGNGSRISDSMLKLNPFTRFFNKNRSKTYKRENTASINSQGVSNEDIVMGRIKRDKTDDNDHSEGYVTTVNIQFDQYFKNKASKIAKYKEMSYYPEISRALKMRADDAIMTDEKGEMVYLKFKKALPEHMEFEIQKIWNYLLNEVFYFKETAWDLYYKWLVEGELYVELIMNDAGNDIIATKVLPAFTMYPVLGPGNIENGFIQSTKGINSDPSNTQSALTSTEDDVVFDRDQVVYVNSGRFGVNQFDVNSFLQPSIRVYNQMKILEDAHVVNALVRAPMRRVFKIHCNSMSPSKTDEYMKNLIQSYRKRIVYDPSTGAMNSSENFQAMTEDIWLAVHDGEEATSVDTLAGDDGFTNMDPIIFHQKKLYMTLELPSSRWSTNDTASQYNSGKNSEITREEIQWSASIQRDLNKFKRILLDSLVTLLRIRGFDSKYIDNSIYDAEFVTSNLFKQYKELEIMESRFGILANANTYMYSKDNESGFFAKEVVLKRFFLMSDQDYDENEAMLNKAKKDLNAVVTVDGDESNDTTNDFTDTDSTDQPLDFGDESQPLPEPTEEVPVEIPEELPATPAESFNYFKLNKPSLLLSEFVKTDKKIIEENKNKFERLRKITK